MYIYDDDDDEIRVMISGILWKYIYTIHEKKAVVYLRFASTFHLLSLLFT